MNKAVSESVCDLVARHHRIPEKLCTLMPEQVQTPEQADKVAAALILQGFLDRRRDIGRRGEDERVVGARRGVAGEELCGRHRAPPRPWARTARSRRRAPA